MSEDRFDDAILIATFCEAAARVAGKNIEVFEGLAREAKSYNNMKLYNAYMNLANAMRNRAETQKLKAENILRTIKNIVENERLSAESLRNGRKTMEAIIEDCDQRQLAPAFKLRP